MHKFSFITLILLLTGLMSPNTKNNLTVYIASLQESDKPYPVIVLKERIQQEDRFPEKQYQVRNGDLDKVRSIASRKGKTNGGKILMVVRVKENEDTTVFEMDREQGLKFLRDVDLLTRQYKNTQLQGDLKYLQIVTRLFQDKIE